MNKLEELMGYYRVKEEDMNGLSGEAGLSENEKKFILQKTLEKAGLATAEPSEVRSETAKKLPRRRFTALIAACIAIMALGVVSYAAVTLSPSLQNLLHPADDEQREMLNSSGTVIDKQFTHSGVTIDIKEAVGDRNLVYVLYDIIAPEGMVLDKAQYSFQEENISVTSAFRLGEGSGWSTEDLIDDNPGDNKVSRILCYQTSGSLSGSTMEIGWKDLAYWDDGERITLIPGEWKVQFPLEYKDQSVSWNPHKKVDFEDGTSSTIVSVRVSPISASIELTGGSLGQIHLDDFIIKTKDGPAGSRGGGVSTSYSTSELFSKSRLTKEFLRIIPLSEIESIELYGVTIPMKR